MSEISPALTSRPHVRPPEVSTLPARLFLAAVVAFIVYGSLFPFDFSGQAQSLESFFAESRIFANRADAIDNFILFLPLGVAVHLAFRSYAARATAVLLAVLLLALGIQLLQLYLPSRIASVADAFWNTAGLGVGLLVAARVRHAFRAQLSADNEHRDLFLACLVLLWFLYESFPFVPTLDIGLLRAHVKSVVFAPPFEPMRLFQHGLAATLAGIAVTGMGMLRRPLAGVIGLGVVAVGLEVLVAYGSLRRETLLGIVAGLAAGFVVGQRASARSHDAVFVLALGAYLVTVLTPYRGQMLDGGFTLTPFSHLLWRGVLKEVPPAAFEALAIGAMLWAGMAGPARWRRRPLLWSALVLLLLVVLEWVRVAIVGVHGDTTTLAMALMLAPAAVALRAGVGEPAAEAELPPPAQSTRLAHPLLPLAVTAAVLTLAMWLVLQLPGIPYNLKKLFGEHALAGAAVFSLALLWLGGGPWLAARAVLQLDARRRHGALWTPPVVVGLALVSYALVNLATPAIMLEKIIGAPDLYRRVVDDNYWGEAWRTGLAGWPRVAVDATERLVRFVALYAVFAIPLVVGLAAIARRDRRARVMVLVLCLLPFWVLAKYVVLDWAITDNLTELVVDGGAFYLALAVALFAANAVLLGGGMARRPVLLAATGALLGASWLLLNQAIETVVINGGRVFGGLQFLLGQDRTTLLSAPELFARWGALYLAALAAVVAGIVLARRLRPLPAAS
ncbi:VanZ family protein [Massilia sp. TWR1-2-2]|uniref:VanZ family protein n=1 Tax=Massilia sp. TWR1-2-2 TaxID=2804584 RepID=UPI003CE6EB46